MPEYLAPGVYIEETSFRDKTIEGVSTSNAGFVGPTLFGPTSGEPELLTSFADFQRIYGGLNQLNFTDAGSMHNYLAHAVRAFFENRGRRLYVSRVYEARAGSDGRARRQIGAFNLAARYPGSIGNNITVRFIFKLGQNILGDDNGITVLRGARDHDIVWVSDLSSPISSLPGSGMFYRLERYFDQSTRRHTFRLRRNNPDHQITLAETDPNSRLTPDIDEVRILTVNVIISGIGPSEQTWEDLSFHPPHTRSLVRVFLNPNNVNNREFLPLDRTIELYVSIMFDSGTERDGVAIAETLLTQPSVYELAQPRPSGQTPLNIIDAPDNLIGDDAARRAFQVTLADGNDGQRPAAREYEGRDGSADGLRSGLRAFEDVEDISIVAAPGSTYNNGSSYARSDTPAILGHLISHCERMRYRIAVLDSVNGDLISSVRAYRGRLDSTHAALYYPWVRILDPVTEQEINLPPSGFVAGIYARNDTEHGVHKAPANEVVQGAIGFEYFLNKSQQDVLNPDGINCFRFFEGRGYRLWGARTISSDLEWKYVNLRRYFAFLERSIERSTQWIVFENNTERLWGNVRRTVESFLFNEWKSGHLMGTKREEAYFVRCDRSTMTQNDIDNGRLICLIGVAPVRPAEFVIFRIGQWTADHRG